MATLDSILNIGIPIVLILVFIAFIWIKTPLGDWLGPILGNFWAWIKGEGQAYENSKQKVIAYE